MGKPRTSEEHKKEAARIRSARYYLAHPERAKEASKRWRDKDRRHVNAIASNYARRNRVQYRAYCIARRTKKTEAGGYFTAKEWTLLCEQYKNVCLCCKESKPLTADHVLPISKGGTSWIKNIQPLCLSCNCSKGDKDTDYREDQG